MDPGAAAAPDETTICRFRHLLEKHDLCGMMLDAGNIHLEAKGIKIVTGTIVDATRPVAKASTMKSIAHSWLARSSSGSAARSCTRRWRFFRHTRLCRFKIPMTCSSLKRLLFIASVLSSNLRENSSFKWRRLLGARQSHPYSDGRLGKEIRQLREQLIASVHHRAQRESLESLKVNFLSTSHKT